MRKKPGDERAQKVIDMARTVIKADFPKAGFQVHRGDDLKGNYIDAHMKAENTFNLLDLIGDRLVGLYVEEGWDIYTVSLLKAER